MRVGSRRVLGESGGKVPDRFAVFAGTVEGGGSLYVGTTIGWDICFGTSVARSFGGSGVQGVGSMGGEVVFEEVSGCGGEVELFTVFGMLVIELKG